MPGSDGQLIRNPERFDTGGHTGRAVESPAMR
jgi:hypothetical protein